MNLSQPPVTLSLLNLSITLAGIFLCLIGIFQVRMIFRSDPRINRYFTIFFAALLVFALSNMTGQLLRGAPGSAARAILIVSNYLEMTISSLLTYIAARYFLSVMDPDKEKRKMRIILAAMFGAQMVLILLSQFTGLFYIIDAVNLYRRTEGYPFSYIIPGAILLLCAVLLYREHSKLSRKEHIAFVLFVAIPLIAMILQLFIYGIYIIVFASVLTGLLLYVFIISDQEEKLEQQTRELSELKTTILTQQIQPHFIYNTMNTAFLLSQKDPEQARRLIRDFTIYLKSNIGALSTSVPVPFSEEINCTRAYVDILLTRFEGRFTVEYDIPFTDFSLPALTLQPIVENAIKHGVLQSDKPGRRILISTMQDLDSAIVIVDDNGPGFDIGSAPTGESTHIGLGNVSERLQLMSGGTLLVDSVPGAGTTVTIRVPKEQ